MADRATEAQGISEQLAVHSKDAAAAGLVRLSETMDASLPHNQHRRGP
jgi:hypothetical protein